jgi:hypothetical protein
LAIFVVARKEKKESVDHGGTKTEEEDKARRENKDSLGS